MKCAKYVFPVVFMMAIGAGLGAFLPSALAMVVSEEIEDFGITASPSSRSAKNNETVTYDVGIDWLGSWDSDVDLSVSGLPAGTTASLSPDTITSDGGQATLTVDVGASTPTGTYRLTITGEGIANVVYEVAEVPVVSHSTTVTLIVKKDEDFAIRAAPSSLLVNQGETGRYTITTDFIDDWTSPVDLSVSGMPSGVSARIEPSVATRDGQQSALIVDVGVTVPAGKYTLTIQGVDGEENSELVRTATVVLEVGKAAVEEDFSLDASPSSRLVNQGETGSYTITTDFIDDWTAPVNLSVSGIPSGVLARIEPSVATRDGQQGQLIVDVGAAVPPGTYTLTVQGKGRGENSELTRTTTVILEVGEVNVEEDFRLDASPSSREASRGDTVNFTVTTDFIDDWKASVYLSVLGLPAGITARIEPAVATQDGQQSQLIVNVGAAVPPGTYTLTVQGKGRGENGELIRTTTVTLEVIAVNVVEDFSLSAQPGSITITQGENAQYDVAVDFIGAWSSPVKLQLSGLPAGVSARLTPDVLTRDGQQGTLVITSTANLSPGTYNLRISGSGTGSDGKTVTHYADVQLIVEAEDLKEDFRLDASPQSRVVSPGGTANFTVTTDFIDDWTAPVNLSVVGLPVGITARIEPAVAAQDGQQSQLAVNVGQAVAQGTYTLTVQGKGTGKNGELIRTTAVTLEVGAMSVVGDFTISARPDTLTISQGENARYDVTAHFTGTWSSPVQLGVSGLPAGVTARFNPETITSSGQGSVLSITDTAGLSPGTYHLRISGEGKGADGNTVTRYAEVKLIVGESGFTLDARPDYLEAEIGQTVESTVRARFKGACKGPLELEIPRDTLRKIPDGLKLRLADTILKEEAASTLLEAEVGADVPIGVYPVVIEARGCGVEAPQTAVVQIEVKPLALRLVKAQSQNRLLPGMAQIYSLTLINEGETAATGVVVSDAFNSNLKFLNDTVSGAEHQVQNGVHTWRLNRSLAAGETFVIKINLRADRLLRPGVSISNTAKVIADQVPEPVVSNTVTAISGLAAVEPEGLQVTKRVLKRNARIGSILIYRIDVRNVSKVGPIFDITLEDKMPQGFKIPDGKTLRDGARFTDPERSGRTWRWTLGALAAGDKTTITYQAVVGTNADGGRNKNTAIATGKDGGGNRVRGWDSAVVMLGSGSIEELGEIRVQTWLDQNNNQQVDGADKPLPEVEIVMVPPGIKQTTDEEGEALFAGLNSGQYLLAVNELALEDNLKLVGAGREIVRLIEGEHASVAFLLAPSTPPATLLGRLIGTVFYDVNENTRYDAGEPFVPEFTVSLGEKTLRVRGGKGLFSFVRLEPGTYPLVVRHNDREKYRSDIEIKPGKNTVDVPFPWGEIVVTISAEPR